MSPTIYGRSHERGGRRTDIYHRTLRHLLAVRFPIWWSRPPRDWEHSPCSTLHYEPPAKELRRVGSAPDVFRVRRRRAGGPEGRPTADHRPRRLSRNVSVGPSTVETAHSEWHGEDPAKASICTISARLGEAVEALVRTTHEPMFRRSRQADRAKPHRHGPTTAGTILPTRRASTFHRSRQALSAIPIASGRYRIALRSKHPTTSPCPTTAINSSVSSSVHSSNAAS